MNRIQRKIGRIAKNRMKELEAKIIIPCNNPKFFTLDILHPECKDYFNSNRTMRRYKKEARKQLKEEGVI